MVLSPRGWIAVCAWLSLILVPVFYYYWKRWDTFRSSARAMIDADDRTNNEFYLCPVYNHTPGTIRAIPVNEMHGVGTPEDLNTWLNL